VSEIMVNRFDSIYVEQRGQMNRVDSKLSEVMLQGAIAALANSVNTPLNRGTANGIINAGHGNLRIAAVTSPTAVDGDALSIRRHRDQHFFLDDYVKMGALSRALAKPITANVSSFEEGLEDEALAAALKYMVVSRNSAIIAAGTSGGKTSFLNAVNACIPPEERLITIEDTVELQPIVPNRVRLLANKEQGVTARLLVQLCLRMRPDRIIMGEVRGGEAFDLLQALNTGHEGGYATLHSNTAASALSRLETMAMLGLPEGSKWEMSDMRKTVAEAINYVIHFRKSGELRHVSEILEVRGYDERGYDLRRVF